MGKVNFVENCFVLRSKVILDNLDDVMQMGNFLYKQPLPGVDYFLDDFSSDNAIVMVSIEKKKPQKIEIEFVDLTYGQTGYFRCECGKRVSKLYLPPQGTKFACRSCHGLRYRLSTLNRNSIAGKSIYQIERINKLSSSRAGMDRIFYNGEYTKRFNRFLKQCEKAGLDSIVKGARDLKALIYG